MTASETLREFERKLVPHRTIAGSEAAWDKYAGADLPPSLSQSGTVLVHQGWDAGYQAAMNIVRGLLAEQQTAALRGRLQRDADAEAWDGQPAVMAAKRSDWLRLVPTKVLPEFYVCNHETPKRCRKRATYYMDGSGFCDEHVGSVSPSVRQFVSRARYEVAP